MASKTPNIGLVKQEGTEYGDYEVTNQNWDLLDNEIAKRGKTVNGKEADENGNYQIDEVSAARQIVTNDEQQSAGEYYFRTTGGDASLTDGDAKLLSIHGRSVHTGAVSESLTLTVSAVPREEGEDSITAEIDRDTFVAYVTESGTITLSYTNAWSANPALYGVEVTGTPVSGDQIVIVYVKENRGLITNSAPSRFISTGWNLYDNANGYARAKKYSDNYGFLIGGTYTKLEIATTLTGSKTTITPVSGAFTIPSDGYLFVTGGNATDTYIMMTWSDWRTGPDGGWKAYSESVVDFSSVVSTNFPNGMFSVGAVADELDFIMGKAISRIERLAYTSENISAVIASGRNYDADEDYIYVVRESEVTAEFSVDGSFTANDHGLEIVDGTTVPVYVVTIYGQNLVDRLRTDIPNQITSLNQAIENLQDGLAIVANGNTHAAIASGQFVYVKNHSSLADGLYTAMAAIATNATLSASNLSADASGGLNALNSKIMPDNKFSISASTTHTLTVPNQSANIVAVSGGGGSRQGIWFVYCGSIGNVTAYEVVKGSNITFTTGTNSVTVSLDTSSPINVRVINVSGQLIS